MSTFSKDSIVIDILNCTFGSDTVSEAMKYKACYNDRKGENRRLIEAHFNVLSLEWQKGNAKNYLESLDKEIQNFIICHLLEDYVIDKSREV